MAVFRDTMATILKNTLSLPDSKYKRILQKEYPEITTEDAHRAKEGFKAFIYAPDKESQDKAIQAYTELHNEFRRKYKKKKGA